ncbi:glycosyl transferase family 1 [Iodidimonas gelatinilytica]|uniref:Glycosyl transferase family 1 n=1 Tax=Iodidimonas gelatinilytica TaxID=1236966 RepID=A0A5A7MWL6_9PROT|nr:glycosyltransferase family 4 protein [Iodidimonas gelatinilytica]GER00227.1 glycosyl transferase family 1 [Iodidimonas gelatinilytica]
MNLLVFSTLFPNARQPHHGVFVENRLRHLQAMSGYHAHIVAPVPWFPSRHPKFGGYADYAGVPRFEQRHGLNIYHPRYVVVPKMGMLLTPYTLYLSARRVVRRLLNEEHRFDLLDAHYFYPDGVAASLLAQEFDLPFTITGRGTDLNLIPKYKLPRRMIRKAAERADGLITVCAALADDLAALGIDRDRVTVLRNGVDLIGFSRDEAGASSLRTSLGIKGPVLASVGHLIERKSHDLVIRALAHMGRGSLLIAGKGPEEAALRQLAKDLNVADHVHFLGLIPHAQLSAIYSAADVFVLASSREGWPNVLLESMACGTPVVATAVNGSPEVVQSPVAGRIVPQRTGEALAAAIEDILKAPPSPAHVRGYAEGFSWEETSRGQMDLFTGILAKKGRTSA